MWLQDAPADGTTERFRKTHSFFSFKPVPPGDQVWMEARARIRASQKVTRRLCSAGWLSSEPDVSRFASGSD
jgi:hypothetical protein